MLRFKPIEASRSRQWTATDGATTVATIIITDTGECEIFPAECRAIGLSELNGISAFFYAHTQSEKRNADVSVELPESVPQSCCQTQSAGCRVPQVPILGPGKSCPSIRRRTLKMTTAA
jgi:hypothetical protein